MDPNSGAMITGKSGTFVFLACSFGSIFCLPSSSASEATLLTIFYLAGYLFFLTLFYCLKNKTARLVCDFPIYVVFGLSSLPWITVLVIGESLPFMATAICVLLLSGYLSFFKIVWGTLWGLFFETEPYRDKFMVQMGGGCIVACCALLLVFSESSMIVVDTVGLIVSLAATLIIGYFLLKRSRPNIMSPTWEDSRANEIPRTPIWMRSYVTGFAITALSLALLKLCDFQITLFFSYFFIGTVVGQGILLIVTIAKKRIPSLVYVDMIVFLAIETFILLGPIASLVPVNLSAPLILGALMAHVGGYSYAVYLSSHKNRISPLFHYVRRHLRPTIGALIGAATYWVMNIVSADNAPMLLSVIVLTLILISNAGSTLVQEDWNSLYELSNGILLEVPEESREALQAGQIDGSKPKHRPFSSACERLAQRFQLTSRELDVLILLGQGRNAESIGQILFISRNTARSHIYRIYKKTAVENQQELIDMIDAERAKTTTAS